MVQYGKEGEKVIGNFWLILSVLRSVPAFLVFLTLHEKQAVIEDMRQWEKATHYGVYINYL